MYGKLHTQRFRALGKALHIMTRELITGGGVIDSTG